MQNFLANRLITKLLIYWFLAWPEAKRKQRCLGPVIRGRIRFIFFANLISFGISLNSVNLYSQINLEESILKHQVYYKDSNMVNERVVTFGFAQNRWYNPVESFLSISIFIYQKYISQQISATCAYIPSCSTYSKNLINDFGLIKGVLFASDRLTRCNRIALADLNKWRVNKYDMKIHESTSYYIIKSKQDKHED